MISRALAIILVSSSLSSKAEGSSCLDNHLSHSETGSGYGGDNSCQRRFLRLFMNLPSHSWSRTRLGKALREWAFPEIRTVHANRLRRPCSSREGQQVGL